MSCPLQGFDRSNVLPAQKYSTSCSNVLFAQESLLKSPVRSNDPTPRQFTWSVQHSIRIGAEISGQIISHPESLYEKKNIAVSNNNYQLTHPSLIH